MAVRATDRDHPTGSRCDREPARRHRHCRASLMTSDPTPRPQPSRSQPPTTAPITDEMSGTDLPLPRWGSGGITVDHIEALLDAAVAAVPAPPLHDTSRTALYGWLRDVQAGLVSRREQLWMARRVTEAFHAERSSAEAIERTRRAVRHHEDIAEMRQAGTWWSEKDAARRSRRPARFAVDDATWERHRRRAEAAGVGLGEHLGALLASRASSTDQRRPSRPVAVGEMAPTRFIRIAISDQDWADLKAAARSSNQTLTAHISHLIAHAR